MLISVHDKTLKRVAFLDNEKPNTLHYYDDTWHRYLAEATSTFDFSVPKTGHKDLEYLNEKGYVSFNYNGKSYLLSIMKVEETELKLTCYCENLNLELLNETSGPYKSDGAKTYVHHLKALQIDEFAQLEIGINEVSDLSRALEWDGTETKLARLLSLVGRFDAECEFETHLNRDGTLEKIVLNTYRKHDANVQGVGTRRNDTTLYYGKQIKEIRRTVDKTGVYTAIRPVGKDGLTISTINKTEHDEDGNVLFISPSGDPHILCPSMRDVYPSQMVDPTGDKYINLDWAYDTENINMLYGQALAKLKYIYMPAITYEVTGFFDLDIGDTVKVHDDGFKPLLLLEARVSEQAISFSNPSRNKTTFANFKALENRLSTGIQSRLDELIKQAIPYMADIISTNGLVFKNNQGSTTLTARVTRGTNIITEQMLIRWYKDDVLVSNEDTITINASDVSERAVYKFEALDLLQSVKCFAEVTIIDVSDGQDGPQGPQGEKGDTGSQGIQGPKGNDGQSQWTHIRYSVNATGTSFTTMPVETTKYIGIAITTSSTAPTGYASYSWAKFIGEDGDPGQQGIPGEKGANGVTYYTWIRYADTPTTGMSNNPSGKLYIGIAHNKTTSTESDAYTDYTWSLIKGEKGDKGDTGSQGLQGLQGAKGDQGIKGETGANGLSSYTHIAYATGTTGQDFSVAHFESATYIGMYVDNIANDSTSYASYKWSLIKGADGSQGIQGAPGADGQTPYFHTAWANSSDGVAGFSTTVSLGKTYIGTYTDFISTDSTVPSKYKWTLIKGDKGDKGDQGTQGPKGNDGKGIVSAIVTYQNHTNGATAPTGTWSSTIPTPVKGQYLWTRTITTYTDASSVTTYSVAYNATDGQNGTDGKGISSTVIHYQLSTSGTTVPTGTWLTSVPTPIKGRYLWTRTVINYTSGSPSTGYSTSYYATDGQKGDKGDKGDTGVIVSATAPSNPTTGQLWQDTSTGIIKKWSGSAWTIWYMDVTNLSVENLTAISAKLGKFSVTDAGLQYGDMSSLGSLISATDTEFSIGVKTAAINGTSSITIGNTSNLGLSGLFGANKKAMFLSSDYFYFSGVSYLAGNTTISGTLKATGEMTVNNQKIYAWKYYGMVGGRTLITLPAEFQELYIWIYNAGAVIPKQMLTEGATPALPYINIFGHYYTPSDYSQTVLEVVYSGGVPTGVMLLRRAVNGTEYVNTTITKMYYR